MSILKNPKTAKYSIVKILFVRLENYLKYLFYSFVVFLSFFTPISSKKKILNFGSFQDTRFINFLIFSLCSEFIFSVNLDIKIFSLIKKIGIVNFLKFFHINFKVRNKKKYLIVLNNKLENKKEKLVIPFDTNYFDFVINKKNHNSIIMPYYLYPRIYNKNYSILHELKNQEKCFKIVFSGSVHPDWYDKFNWNNIDGSKMLTRNEILHFVIREFNSEIFYLRNYKDLNNAKISKKKIIFSLNENLSTKSKSKLSNIEHLKFISKSNFFLTAPGTGMPLCHHLIEAIKFTTIPITSYGHLLFPSLNEQNSISFGNFNSLYKAIEKAILMKDQEILEKRKNLENFYNNSLSPSSFRKKFIEASTDKIIVCCNDHESVNQFLL